MTVLEAGGSKHKARTTMDKARSLERKIRRHSFRVIGPVFALFLLLSYFLPKDGVV
jgi:hypothetical protein